jgi:hypothetical protein
MTTEDGLKAFLAADATLNGLLAGRIYPDVIPQGVTARPALTYQRTSTDRPPALSGQDTGFERAGFILRPHSTKRTECNAVRDRLVAMLNGLACRGTWGGAGGVSVDAAIVEAGDAGFAQGPDGSETGERDEAITVTIIRSQ